MSPNNAASYVQRMKAAILSIISKRFVAFQSPGKAVVNRLILNLEKAIVNNTACRFLCGVEDRPRF